MRAAPRCRARGDGAPRRAAPSYPSRARARPAPPPGYNRDDKKYKPETHRERIFANHIGSYMQEVQEEDPETFAKRFSKYIEHDVDPDGMEDLIKSVHEAIRADPSPAPKKAYTPDKSFRKPAKLSLEERRARNEAKRAARLAEAKEKAAAGGGDDEEAEEDEE